MTGKNKQKKDLFRLPYLTLIVSLLVTIGVTYIFFKSSQEKDIARFKQQTVQIDAGINSRIRTYIALLKSGRGFIETSDNVNRETFRRYINSLDLNRNYPGVQGIGYAKRVLSYETESIAQKMAAEGVSDFKVFPQTSKYDYISILYLEPLDERNRRAIGFDMSSEPIRKEAIERARDTNEPAVTGKVFLVQEKDDDKQAGFLIYVPVYRGENNPVNVEERRRLLDGFIYSPFRAGNFLEDVKSFSANDDIAVRIYDSSVSPENILAETNSKEIGTSGYVTASEINVAGKKWIVEYHSLAGFTNKSSGSWAVSIFVGGLIFSLILFGMTYLETLARERAETMAKDLRISEREKERLFEKEQEARKFAEDASRTKDEFISVVSHELRTPLNSIAGWTKILQSPKLNSDMKAQALEKIERNLRIQTLLVEELLDFSHIFSGKNDLILRSADISQILEESFEKIEKQAADKQIFLLKDNQLTNQKISADSERLKKAIVNVLSNAVKFTPENGQIIVKTYEKNNNIEIKVEDTGQGIAAHFLPYIFEGFRQADSSSTRQHGGLGLGLAISQQIFELHGGKIYADSEGEGKGAVFTIILPVEKQTE